MTIRPPSADRDSSGRFGTLGLLYAAFIVYGTLIPFNRCTTVAEIHSNIASIRWIPFMDSRGSRASIPDVVQNVLLFVPFGFLGAISLRRHGRSAILTITILGALLSGGVEILQLLTVDRITSATDLATNTIGTAVGALIATFVCDRLPGMVPVSISQRLSRNEYSFLFASALSLVLLGALQPFDFTLDVGAVWAKVKSLLQHPFAFGGPLRDEGVVFLRFVLLGCASVLWFRRWNGRAALISGVVFTAAVGAIFEAAQLVVASRMPNARDGLVAIAGAIAGGCLSRVSFRSRPPMFWSGIVIAATSVTAAIQILSPFRLSEQYRRIHLFPFLFYYERTTFVAVSNFIESALMFLPLGFLLQLFQVRTRHIQWTIAGITAATSLSLELAQGWIHGRYPDITDVLGAIAGALMGVWLFRQRTVLEGLWRPTSKTEV